MQVEGGGETQVRVMNGKILETEKKLMDGKNSGKMKEKMMDDGKSDWRGAQEGRTHTKHTTPQ